MIKPARTVVLGLTVVVALTATGPARFAHAQSAYPNRPVTVIAPFAAGGDSDLSARNLANVIPKYLGQPLVVVNRPGASGVIGSQQVRTSPADGYTLLLARIGSQAITPALDPKTPYKWNDFTFLTLLELNPFVCVVKADAPWRTLAALIDEWKRSPGKLNYASAGEGTIQHLGPQLLFNIIGLPKESAVHVPYKGGGEATTALIAGQVQFICNNLTTILAHIKSGVFRALMTTTAQRLEELPEVPTARELGYPRLEAITGWSALYGPPGLPKEVVARWSEAMQRIARDPEWLAGNVKIGGIPAVRSAQDTEQFAREQHQLYEGLAQSLGLRR